MTNDEMNPTWLSLVGGGNEKSRLRNALILGGAALATYRQGEEWLRQLRSRSVYTLTVTDTDVLFTELHAWVIEQLPPVKRRSLRVTTRRIRSSDDDWFDDDEDDEVSHRIAVMYDGARVQKIELDGHTIEISVDEASDEGFDKENSKKRIGKPGKLTIRCTTVAARDAVLRLLQELASTIDKRHQGTSRVYISTAWGHWHMLGDIVPRPLDSVVLAGDLRDDLLDDMKTFIAQEPDYRRLGIPWHRGYLLHGPPGTGKTSIAQALAGSLNMDVYYIPLSDMNSDTDLMSMLSRITPRSLLLLEDVDVAHAARERDDKEKGISLSGLLNALDGIVTPHGLITVMTTNDINALDEALIRPGRADRQVAIGCLDEGQLVRLLHGLLGVDVVVPPITPADEITPAEVVEVIKPFIGADALEAAAAVQRYVTERLDAQKADPEGSAS